MHFAGRITHHCPAAKNAVLQLPLCDNCPASFPKEAALSEHKPLITFTPAKLRPRYDGWTAEKQVRFIEALSETKCVDEACRRVGMSDTSAYELRRRACGAAFARAWDAALDFQIHALEQSVISRAIHGVPRPIFYKGEQIGEWRHYDERLSMFLLRSRRPARYGKWLDRMLPPDRREQEAEHYRLEDHLTEIELRAPLEHGNLIEEEDDEDD